MSEKFSLKWNDFQSNVSRTFGQLRSEEEFFDVSLVSDDQKMLSAHKLVLSASSPYFKHILTTNKHSHPLLCLDGVSSAELQCVLDYIYQGEVQIYQEQLDRFLVVAQRLQLEGVTCQDDGQEREINETIEDIVNEVPEETIETRRKEEKKTKTEEEINQQLSEYVIRGEDGLYSCGYCDKSGGKNFYNMRNHVEIHIEGLSFPCQSCAKTFKTRNILARHKHFHHSNNTPWSADEQKLLEQALKTFPSSTPERWERIAESVPNRSKKDCMKTYKVLAETIKAKKAALAKAAKKS